MQNTDHLDLSGLPEQDLFRDSYISGTNDGIESVMDAVLGAMRHVILAKLSPEAFKIALMTLGQMIQMTLDNKPEDTAGE